jgi:hypothetical protein
MALPYGSPQLCCEATPNSVAVPLHSFAIDSIPSSAMDNKSINPMHTDDMPRGSPQLCYGAQRALAL